MMWAPVGASFVADIGLTGVRQGRNRLRVWSVGLLDIRRWPGLTTSWRTLIGSEQFARAYAFPRSFIMPSISLSLIFQNSAYCSKSAPGCADKRWRCMLYFQMHGVLSLNGQSGHAYGTLVHGLPSVYLEAGRYEMATGFRGQLLLTRLI